MAKGSYLGGSTLLSFFRPDLEKDVKGTSADFEAGRAIKNASGKSPSGDKRSSRLIKGSACQVSNSSKFISETSGINRGRRSGQGFDEKSRLREQAESLFKK